MNTKCLFCEIVAGREKSEKLTETSEFIIIKDKFPKYPLHFLVISKKHIVNLLEAEDTDLLSLSKFISEFNVIKNKLKKLDKGFTMKINNGRLAKQEIQHFHIHLYRTCE